MFDFVEDSYSGHNLTPAVLAAALSACATETVLLNSDRIELQFGSYGIDVLASEASLRRSSLFSTENGERTCRTYAVVRFTDEPDSSYSPEHTKVLAGNSLGEVFKANGWSIHKQTLHIGSFPIDQSSSETSQLMRIAASQVLALHVYQLLLVRNQQVFEYATIIEAHHPEYLSESDLLEMYKYDESESMTSASILKLVNLITSHDST